MVVGAVSLQDRANLASLTDSQRFRIIKNNLNEPQQPQTDGIVQSGSPYHRSSYMSTSHGQQGGKENTNNIIKR